MRAIALLGPNAKEQDVAPFAAAAQYSIAIESAIPSTCDVALIFGGDGTVHRHLPELVRSQVPALVVPTGSGNDFARSLGLNSRESALTVWKSFCVSSQ